MSLLTLIVVLPLLGAGLLMAVPREYRVVPRLMAMAVTLVVALAAGLLFLRFDSGIEGYQCVTRIPGLGAASLGIEARFGVDGLNLGLILMGAIVAFAATCTAWEIQEREREFYILLLLMTGGILGAFASLDLFFFYAFHELALVPTFIMVWVWGRGADRKYAAFKMTLYLSLGALILLAGLIALYLHAGAKTFDIEVLTEMARRTPLAGAAQRGIFPLLLFGFGILVALWPFHTWAPLGYAAAPTATAMLHAGVLKKFGLYGLIRIALPILPEGAHSWMGILAALAVGNLVWCGLVAMRQRDLNLMLGNSSVAHMGFAFLGIASLGLIGVTGAVVVMVAHGFLAALSFGLSGQLYQQTRTLEMTRLGGLARQLPFLGTVLIMALLAGCGLPGFANFVGEVMVFFGAWEGFTGATVAACWGGLVIGAVYVTRAIRTMLHGPVPGDWTSLRDVGPWRRVPFVILLTGLLIFGTAPRTLTDRVEPAVHGALMGSGAPPVLVGGSDPVVRAGLATASRVQDEVTVGVASPTTDALSPLSPLPSPPLATPAL